MGTSIRKQFAGVFIALMAGTILLCWFINNIFLESFYVSNKEKTLRTAYEKLNSALGGEERNLEALEDLNEYFVIYNITTVVIESTNVSHSIFESSNGGAEPRLIGSLITNLLYLYESADNPYRIRDRNKEYLEMFGFLNNGSPYIVRTPVESIQESARIANRFLAYVGSIMVMFSGIIIWFISRKITDPILELTGISERMNHLDFEAKYYGRSRNEISLLGENINKLSATLEATISELKTANNELMRDIEKKEQMEEMRMEFLSNVSHELKTPIALIQGYAEGLQEGINEDPDSRQFYCEVIMDEASKMNIMVKKLMTLNQLEFGNDTVTLERFDIAMMIRNYIQSAGILTKQNGIEVRMEESGPVYVWADEFKTEEVFMNYFTNAMNHCSGKKIIDIQLKPADGKVRISVFNTGEPIPEDAVDHLWEKFYKVDKARTREYGGSGVGLSIVKAIMDSMNQEYGTVNYDNGVMFWFELEAAKEDERLKKVISTY